MILTKNVDGVDIPLTQDEIKAFALMESEFQNQLLTIQINQFNTELTFYLDAIAAQKQYDSALSCASYNASTNIQWKNEANAFIAWRDLLIAASIVYQTNIMNGNVSNPSFDDFLNNAPVLIWP